MGLIESADCQKICNTIFDEGIDEKSQYEGSPIHRFDRFTAMM